MPNLIFTFVKTRKDQEELESRIICLKAVEEGNETSLSFWDTASGKARLTQVRRHQILIILSLYFYGPVATQQTASS